MPTEAEARTQLADLYRELGRLGLIEGSAGNVSLRHGADMLITPSGTSPVEFTPERGVLTDFEGRVPAGAVPSSEWVMHARIYQARDEARCIVHTHCDACTSLASLGEGLPAFHYMIANFGGDDVRCAPYVTFGTHALADAAVQALRDRTACLLANHGMIVHAPTPRLALSGAILLETLARQYLMARAAGTPWLLTVEQMRDARHRFESYNAGRG